MSAKRADTMGRVQRLDNANEWFRSTVCAGLPERWKTAFVRVWERGGDVGSVRRSVVTIKSALNATDDELRANADSSSLRCRRAMMQGLEMLRVTVADELAKHGVVRDLVLDRDDGALGGSKNKGLDRWRVCDSRWWLGVVRRAHGVAVESAAFRLGMVARHADCYVSRESLERRRQQRARNASMVDGHDVVSDDGETVSLRSVVDASVANPAIRRGELMVRMNGFQSVANGLGHRALFVTVTCPSRFHRFASFEGGKSRTNRANEKENLTPADGQRHLLAVFARVRAKLARDRVAVYGFRVAEPHHDGCPHHHFVLFCESKHRQSVARVFYRYALEESPDEPGARKARCKIKFLHGVNGAVAYVAKYIAKNIDGYAIDRDLLGNDAVVASERIEAWASTWRIRQFQQFGGPPVGAWRECRRVGSVDVSGALAEAVAVCHRVGDRRADFGAFVSIMGGPFARRSEHRVRVVRSSSERLTRYGFRDVVSVEGVCNASDGALVATRARVWSLVRRNRSTSPLGLVSITVRAENGLVENPIDCAAMIGLNGRVVSATNGEIHHGTFTKPKKPRSQVNRFDRCDLR